MAESELHFCRIRTKDSKEPFTDPTADIVEVVNQAFKEIPVLFKDLLAEKDLDYIRSITKVLSTRVEEDKAPLDQQLKEFMAAFYKLDQGKRHVIIGYFCFYILCRYMLQLRRDGIIDKEDREYIRASSALLPVFMSLDEQTYAAVRDQISQYILAYIEEPVTTVKTVDAVCVENDRKIEDIKDIAAQAVGATGSMKWKDVAAACDKFVLDAKEGTDEDKLIAVSLAYPDYKTPYFELGVTDE